jgi:hypothetical protein
VFGLALGGLAASVASSVCAGHQGTTSARSFAFGAGNATVDVADLLIPLAIGDTGVPVDLSPGRGFTIASLDL